MHQGHVHRNGIGGVYALRQVSTLAQWNQAQIDEMSNAVALGPHRALSIRIPWKILEPTQGNYDDTLPNLVRQLADALGIDLAIRPMAGGNGTPQWLLNLCRTWTTSGGLVTPSPLMAGPSGQPNAIFLDALEALFMHYAAWGEQPNAVSGQRMKCLFGTWFGQLWAEPYGNDAELLYPTIGFDQVGNNWVNAMIELGRRMKNVHDAHPSITIELPSSGTYSSQPQTFGSAVLGPLATLWGFNSPYWYISENGVPTYPGLGNANTSRKAQMDKPVDYSQADWLKLRDVRLIPDHCDMLEVYTNPSGGSSSYTGPGRVYLKSLILESWQSGLLEIGAPPAPVVASFSPASASGAGVPVTITGSNFTGATAVRFNGVPSSFVVVNSTTITTTVPAGATTGRVSVTTANGTGVSLADFVVLGVVGGAGAMFTYGSRHRMSST